MATDNREYTEVPPSAAPDVPYYVNAALRDIDKDVDELDKRVTGMFSGTRLPQGQDLNMLTEPGSYGVQVKTDADTMKNLPPGFASGPVTVRRFALQVHQEVTNYAGGRETWVRQGVAGGGFFSWQRTDLSALVLPEIPKVPRSGFKNVPLALNVPETSGTEANTSAAIRWPLLFGVDFKRARLHVRNWAPLTAGGTVYPGAVSFTGAWFGRAMAGNQFSGAPVRVLGAFTTPADGSEYVSPWFDVDYRQDVDALLAVGFTAPGGTQQARSRGGCWRTASAADAALPSGFTGGYSIHSPFDVWLEVEVPGETPVIAAVGDSNTAGTGTFYPVNDSWLAQLCRTARAVPYFMAAHGTTSGVWADAANPVWSRHAAPDLARPDVVINFLGRNDLQPGVTLAAMQDRFRAVNKTAREKLAPTVYAATITPSNAEAAEVRTLRRAYNTWLATKPDGVHDCFDFVSAVSDDDETIRTSDNADGLHFRITGHALIAAKVAARPVTPAVLTQTEIVKLRALAV